MKPICPKCKRMRDLRDRFGVPMCSDCNLRFKIFWDDYVSGLYESLHQPVALMSFKNRLNMARGFDREAFR